jgi:molybdate transport system substrate-binding protein
MRPLSATSDQIGRKVARLTVLFAALWLGMGHSTAADIRVFTSGAPSAVQKAIAGKFTETTGHRVLFTAAVLQEIRSQLQGDEKPDVVVLPAPVIENFVKDGALRKDSRVNLVRVGIGVTIREGTPLPDISSVGALRKTLLNARSIAHPDPSGGGFAGAQIARMFEQLGIAEAVRPKVVLMYAFTGGVANIAKGEAEIGLFNISEILPVKGVTLVGPLPQQLQSYITFAGAVHASSASPEPAAAYLRSLTAAAARESWMAGGFEPLGGAQ